VLGGLDKSGTTPCSTALVVPRSWARQLFPLIVHAVVACELTRPHIKEFIAAVGVGCLYNLNGWPQAAGRPAPVKMASRTIGKMGIPFTTGSQRFFFCGPKSLKKAITTRAERTIRHTINRKVPASKLGRPHSTGQVCHESAKAATLDDANHGYAAQHRILCLGVARCYWL
jgi:hypothetical protein